jgi:hypothetical protein
VTLNGDVDELVDEFADELDPQAESSAATQPNVIVTDRVHFEVIDRPTANIVR